MSCPDVYSLIVELIAATTWGVVLAVVVGLFFGDGLFAASMRFYHWLRARRMVRPFAERVRAVERATQRNVDLLQRIRARMYREAVKRGDVVEGL